MYLQLQETNTNYQNKFTSARKIVNAIRSNKSQTEIDLIRKACEITMEINRNITKRLKMGQNELEIQQMFHNEVEKRGLGFSWQKIGNPAVDVSPKEFGHVLPQASNKIVTKIAHCIMISEFFTMVMAVICRECGTLVQKKRYLKNYVMHWKQ